MSWMHPFRTARRNRATARPFPAAWDEILVRTLPLDQRLPEGDRIELRRRMQIFLAEKDFEGVGGLAMGDEIRVTVAAQACLLLLHRGLRQHLRGRKVDDAVAAAPEQVQQDRNPDGERASQERRREKAQAEHVSAARAR